MVASKVKAITWMTLLQVVGRSFWLQSCWNFQGLQNLGFGFALIPVIKTLYLAKSDQGQALKRHLEFFNTHPYCASIILGVVTQMEEEGLKRSDLDVEQISRIKTGMMGPLAALGDTVYWATLKPVLALIAVALVWTANRENSSQYSLGLWLFVLAYSAAHLSLRFGGVFFSYRRGINIVQDLRRFNPQLIARKLTVLLAVVAGGLISIYPFIGAGNRFLATAGKGLMFIGMTGVMMLGIRKKVQVSRLIYGLIILSMVIAWTGWLP